MSETTRVALAQFPASVQRRYKAVPRKYQKAYLKSVAGMVSPRAAIKAMCLECVGYEIDTVRHCTAPACPLYPLRPYQVGVDEDLLEASELAGSGT